MDGYNYNYNYDVDVAQQTHRIKCTHYYNVVNPWFVSLMSHAETVPSY